MTEAGGTTTLELVSNEGQYSIYRIKNDSWDSTETITIPTTETQISTSSQVVVLGAHNQTTEAQAADGTLTVAYAKATRAFTATETSAASDVLEILFMVTN